MKIIIEFDAENFCNDWLNTDFRELDSQEIADEVADLLNHETTCTFKAEVLTQ